MFLLNMYALGVSALLVVAVFFSGVLYYYIASRRPKNFPPGPATVPLLGNLHQINPSKSFLQFHRWTKEHGSMIGLKFGPQDVVVLNSWKHVRELFDKRGAIYSSRPANYIGNELICPNDTHILLLPYGDGWRALRKTVQALLNVTAVDNLLPIQNAEACQTLHQILCDPDNYYDHIRRYSTAVILASVFGQRGASFNSPKVQALYHVQDQFTALLEPGATPPIDAFPFLKYLPTVLSPWRAKAKKIREEQRALYFGLMDEMKRRAAAKSAPECFMEKVLKQQEKNGLTDEQVVYLGGILMEAGSDTTASTLLSFMLAVIEHPEVLKACQEEADKLCGTQRSPSIDDVRHLTYLRACMDETLRWRPVAAGGIPHVLTQDDTYGDFKLKKGCMVFANAWAIGRDPEEVDSPEEFMPERFLKNKYGSRSTEANVEESHRRVTYSFGAGRRICSGQRLAENSLLVNMAKLCWAFDITSTSPVDSDVETGYTAGFLTAPFKFPAKFVPRSEKHAEIIEREFKESEMFLKRYE